MVRLLSFPLIWLLVAPAVDPGAEEQKPHTLAVLVTDAGESRALADELLASLAADKALVLVERERLKQITQEQALAGVGGTHAVRLEIGRLAGADILVFLGRDLPPHQGEVCLVISETANGLRLGQLRMPVRKAKAEVLAREIQGSLARFPRGVQAVVAVSDFLSRDLSLDHAVLQTRLADLLRENLLQQEGVAVLEVAEAKAIAGEQEISGGKKGGLTPIFLEGEYRTDSPAPGTVQISVTVTLRGPGHEPVKIESGSMPLEGAGRFLIQTVPPALKGWWKTPPEKSDPDKDFAHLVSRADKFAEIGDGWRAADLLEAALLIRPQADEQRVRLIRTYGKAEVPEVWPDKARRSLDDPFWAGWVARVRQTWRRKMQHTEYLVRNRRVDIKTGAELYWRSTRVDYLITTTPGLDLQEECRLKREFIRQIAPRLLQLDSPDTKRPATFRDYPISGILTEVYCQADPTKTAAKIDWDLIGDLLCDILPEELPVDYGTASLLENCAALIGRQEGDKFFQRLIDSPRPVVRAYGRCARLGDLIRFQKIFREEMLVEARSLEAELQREPLRKLDFERRLLQSAREYARLLEQTLHPVTPTPEPSPRFATPTPARASLNEGQYQCDRVGLKPIQMEVAALDGCNSKLVNGRFSAWQMLVPAWTGVDVLFNQHTLVLAGPGMSAREVMADKMLRMTSAVFDGQQLWVSGGNNYGLYVLDSSGKVAARVTSEHGLPDASRAMLHPLGPGKILAVGSLLGRTWIAVIALNEGKPQVKVIHEAIKVWNDGATAAEQSMDPAMRFKSLDWIIEYRDETGRRWAFMGERLYSPLMIDLETMQVGVYPLPADFTKQWNEDLAFPRTNEGYPLLAYFSQAGRLYAAGRENLRTYRLDPRTRRLEPLRKSQPITTCPRGNLNTMGCLAELDGWLYEVGTHCWLRHNLQTGQDEVVVADTRVLPGSSQAWHLFRSNGFGLVGWNNPDHILYQVLLPEPNNPPASAPAVPATNTEQR